MNDDSKTPSRLDQLKKSLYSKNEKLIRPMQKGMLHSQRLDVPKEWVPEKKTNKKTFSIPSSVFKKFFIFAGIFFVASVGFAIFMFYGGSHTVSNNNIDISIFGNSFAPGGEQLPLQVEVSNKNDVALELADLVIQYPKGSSGEASGDYVTQRISLGTIEGGKSVTQNINVVLYGEEGSTQQVKATLEYRIAGSNAIFVKDTSYNVNISTAPLTLTIDGPDQISSNQQVTLTINVTSNVTDATGSMALHIDYPFGFTFQSATPSPDYTNNTWSLGTLAPGVNKTITITGTLVGDEGDDRSFQVEAGQTNPQDQSQIGVQYNSDIHTITIQQPFLATTILVNGRNDSQPVTNSSQSVPIEIDWTNTLGSQLSNVEIDAVLSGNAYDPTSVTTPDGFYDSTKNQITWDQTTVSNFTSIQPGASGSLQFSLNTLPLLGANQSLLNSPSFTIELSVKATETGNDGTATAVTDLEQKTVDIASDFNIIAQASYSTGPFANTGPIPPKVGTPTTYTLSWTVTNTSNLIHNAVATALLPSYITWTGKTSPGTENITYDPNSRTITWQIGDVGVGTGFTGASRQVSFQVSLTPSISQVDSIPQLLLETDLTGQDSFTGTLLSSSRPQVTTTLYNDVNFVPNGDKVVQ